MPRIKIPMFCAFILFAVGAGAASAQAISDGYSQSEFIADLEKNTAFFETPIVIKKKGCTPTDDGSQKCSYMTDDNFTIATISNPTSKELEQVSIHLRGSISPIVVLNIFASMASAVGPDFTGDELQLLWEDTFYQASELAAKGEAATKTLHGLTFTTQVFPNREIIFKVNR